MGRRRSAIVRTCFLNFVLGRTSIPIKWRKPHRNWFISPGVRAHKLGWWRHHLGPILPIGHGKLNILLYFDERWNGWYFGCFNTQGGQVCVWGLRPQAQVRSGPIGPRPVFFFLSFFFLFSFFFFHFFFHFFSFFFSFFFSIFFSFFFSFLNFFFRQLLRLVASRHLEKLMTRNVEIGIGSVNETCGPSVLGSCMLEWLRRKVGWQA